MNVARLLHACALSQPGDLAVRRGEARADYLAVSMAAERIATILSDSFEVNPDQRVALMLPSIPELASVFFGILWAGAVVAVLDPDPTPAELSIAALSDALHWSRARLLVAWHADAERAEAGSAADQTQCLFVEPREFSRMVGHTSPRVGLANRRPDELAVVGRPVDGVAWSFTHGELIAVSRDIARAGRLDRHSTVTVPAATTGQELILNLTAAVTVGAALAVEGADATTAPFDAPTTTDSTLHPMTEAMTASHPSATHGVSE